MQRSSEVSLGRAVADHAGVRSTKWLGLFGRAFTLTWLEIVSWATCEERMISRQHPNGLVLARVIELRHAGGLERIRWGRGEDAFHAFVAHLEQHLPGRRTQSELEPLTSNEHIPR